MKATFLAFFTIFSIYFSPPGNQEAAFKHFFKGNIAFNNKDYGKASSQFRQAYHLLPNNFDIALSYAVSLSMSKNKKAGLDILQQVKISDTDPEVKHKKILKLFATGIINSFHQNFGKAIIAFRKALQKSVDEVPELRSNIHNALGYAIMMNQGVNVDRGAKMEPHLHVQKSDMVRAFTHFQKAIAFDSRNSNAQYNYRTLHDTLKIYKPDAIKTIKVTSKKKPAFVELSQDIFQQIPLSHYNEVVLVLDISGSMVQEKVTCKGIYRFEVMREAVLYMLKELPDSVTVGIGTIGGDCGTVPKLWIPAGSKTRKELIQEIEFLHPDGTTPLVSILKKSPDLFVSKTKKQRALFLISDGENVCKERGTDLCEWASQLKNTTIQILTFLGTELNNVNAFSAYSCLAENTNGQVNYIDNNYCRLQVFSFNLLDAFVPRIPPLQRVHCWGGRYKLWGIFEGFNSKGR